MVVLLMYRNMSDDRTISLPYKDPSFKLNGKWKKHVFDMAECEQMRKGKPFHPSHKKSLEVEEELGLLGDPNKDDGETPMDKTLRLATRYISLVKGR